MSVAGNTEIIFASCLIQVVVWIAITYSYKYCYYDVDKILSSSFKLIQSCFDVKEFEYVITQCEDLLVRLNKTNYSVKLIVMLDIILLYFTTMSYESIAVTGILLVAVTQIVVGYAVVLSVMLKKALEKNISIFETRIIELKYSFSDSMLDD
jgi:hypothetical protein